MKSHTIKPPINIKLNVKAKTREIAHHSTVQAFGAWKKKEDGHPSSIFLVC